MNYGIVAEFNPFHKGHKYIVDVLKNKGENTVTAKGEPPQEALSRPISYEDAFKSINKFGGTPYFNEGGVVRLDDGLFVSAKELNSLRRQAVEKLDAKRAELCLEIATAQYTQPQYIRKNKKLGLVARFESSAQIPDDLSGISAIMLPLEENPDVNINADIVKIVDIPRGILSEDIIAKRLRIFKEKGFGVAACGNIAAVEIAKNEGFEILADTGLNISNGETARVFEEYGTVAEILSPELTIDEAVKIDSQKPLGIVIYGNIPLMLFKNCPIKNGKSCAQCQKGGYLTDRMGIKFPVRCRMGYSEMLNSVPIWLADRKNELNFDFGVLYFTSETKEKAAEIISAYKKGLAPTVKHTRGLYYRGTT